MPPAEHILRCSADFGPEQLLTLLEAYVAARGWFHDARVLDALADALLLRARPAPVDEAKARVQLTTAAAALRRAGHQHATLQQAAAVAAATMQPTQFS